jgi:hypothetical protein
MENGGLSPQRGDRALADALLAHGTVMNGGIDHCVEALSDDEFRAAIKELRYLGANEIADVLGQARGLDVDDPANEERIQELNDDYGRACPNDQVLVDLFKAKLEESPEDFAAV